jgi:hypothetical protein
MAAHNYLYVLKGSCCLHLTHSKATFAPVSKKEKCFFDRLNLPSRDVQCSRMRGTILRFEFALIGITAVIAAFLLARSVRSPSSRMRGTILRFEFALIGITAVIAAFPPARSVRSPMFDQPPPSLTQLKPAVFAAAILGVAPKRLQSFRQYLFKTRGTFCPSSALLRAREGIRSCDGSGYTNWLRRAV